MNIEREAIQRQQILTQKYIALFPDGIEAWAEVRRTGYPKLYPVANSDNADVNASTMISRFNFLDYEYQTNGKAVQAAIPLLNGPDKASTKRVKMSDFKTPGQPTLKCASR